MNWKENTPANKPAVGTEAVIERNGRPRTAIFDGENWQFIGAYSTSWRPHYSAVVRFAVISR